MAVAVKNEGYRRIKIYNGGLKDWRRSGLPLESNRKLPDYDCRFIEAAALHERLQAAEPRACRDQAGRPLVTIVDFRSGTMLARRIGGDRYRIRTSCPIISVQLDDFLRDERLVDTIPRQGLVVTVSETGNRDVFLIRFLAQYGFRNVVGLRYGMRGWLKEDLPRERIGAP